MSSGSQEALAVRSRDSLLLLGLLALAAIYWLGFGLTQRSVVEDEAISILAAEGVLEHGYPRLPSGLGYHRSYLPTYLLAGGLAIFGKNAFSILLPGLLLSLGALLFTARYARDVLGRPHVGLAVGLALLLLQEQTYYATGPRMYASLQLFTLLACASAWRGFVRGEGVQQLVCALAVAGAITSHQQGGALLVALPLAVGVLRFGAKPGRAAPPIDWRWAGVGLAALGALFAATTLYQPDDMLRPVVGHGGARAKLAGLNLSPAIFLEHARAFEELVPGGMLLLPFALAPALPALRPPLEQRRALLFTGLLVALLAAALCLNVLAPGRRFWLSLLPLYLLSGFAGVASVARWARERGAVHVAIGAAAACLALALRFGGAEAPLELLKRAYGPPCRQQACGPDVARQYARLSDRIGAEDRIVSSNPWVTDFYLGRVDALLRERRLAQGFRPFEAATDEYFGIPIVDRPARLSALRDDPGRVWILTDVKLRYYSSPRTIAALRRDFVIRQRSRHLVAFSNRANGDPGEARGTEMP